MSRAMSLKAKIRNIAKQKNIPAQVILQNYMFERLLVRLADSEYFANWSSCLYIKSVTQALYKNIFQPFSKAVSI